ncbi:MAG: riboflavin synthase [Candidatus Eisenbacteria bacterium]|nr:riboflavin synthase [Candidatus Eisenbacteria bacterium]
MFTGIVEEMGDVVGREEISVGVRLTIRGERTVPGLSRGDSIAVSGVCQTVAEPVEGDRLQVIAIEETLRRTNFRALAIGARVNLERPLRLGDRLGGHWVQGHVDGTGRVEEILSSGPDRAMQISLPAPLRRYVVEKGSISVDGVSLTVGRVEDRAEGTSFWVHLIPETLERTLFGIYTLGCEVNLEVDILAKYILRAGEVDALGTGEAR